MTIASRLLVLLIIPLLALVGLGLFAGLRLADIEARSRFIAESRIVALATLGNLSRSFAELRVNVRSHLLATSDERRRVARARFEEDERDVNRLLREYADHLIFDDRDRVLLNAYLTFSREWIDDAKQVISLGDEGRRDDALSLFYGRMSERGLRLSEVSNEWINHDQQAATAAGVESVAGIERFQRQVVVATLAALLATLGLGYVTRRRIVNPIQALDASVNAIAAGEYAKPVPFVGAADETGGLARSIDILKQGAALMDEQRWVKSHVSAVTGELQRAASRAEFGQRLLSSLVPILGGGVGSFYIVDERSGHLQRVASYGFADADASPSVIRFGEGLVGQCARDRKDVTLTNLPPEYLRVESSVGRAAPFQATALPVLSMDAVLGVLEVASFRSFSMREQALLGELLPVIGMSLDILLRHLRAEDLLGQTQAQARQLEKQTADLQRQSERLEASEAELRKGSEQLQRINFQADTALELTKAGYWHVPLDGSGWYNSSERAARIFGDLPNPECRYRLSEWAEHVREGDEEAAKVAMENFAAAAEGRIPVYSAVYAYKRPLDGQVVWIRALGKVVKDASGKPVDMFGVTQDVTDFKRLQIDLIDAKQKAEEATEMKSMFLANMSHEIRTPMNAIIGLSHLALKAELSAKQRDYLSKIHDAGTSLLTVINDILDFSKIEAGRLDVEAIDFYLDDVIGSVTMLTAQKAHEKGLEFLAHVPRDIPERLVGDPLRLGQILTNLVNNAVKFTERGEIRLDIERLASAGDTVQLQFSVRDTGIGMTPEQTAKLFQPFTQADMSTTRKHGGTGLGLTICRRLVELMNGRIWLESEPGAGTSFHFTVPLGLGKAAAKRLVPERLEGLHVLVVDDNPTAREILQESLNAVTRRVDIAASGKEAIAAIRRDDPTDPYDIVFMDWRMPGMDGLQASRHIKSDETLHRQPAIVLVTAFGREEVREEAEHLQLDGFLVKPVTKSMLVDTLVNVFADGSEVVVKRGEADQAQRLRGARILLTEDNEINQQIAIELLEGEGASVDVASNGRQAVERLSGGQTFDVVLMDLQMPEMDGFQATAKLRSDSRFTSLPIIAMTAHATIEERQRCLAAGMNEHIPKPIDPEHLIATVARFYESSPAAPAAAAGIVTPARPQPTDANLPEIDGLDARDGLSRVSGNLRLYRSLLRQFIEQQGQAPSQVESALATGERALAERVAHSLKGVAGNIGATRVHAAAARLESAIRDGSAGADVVTATRELSRVLTPLLSQLQAALGTEAHETQQPAVTASVDPAQALEAAARLATMLSEFDPAAAAFLESNHSALRPLFGDSGWLNFEKLVGGYAFADAQKQLDEAVKGSSRQANVN